MKVTNWQHEIKDKAEQPLSASATVRQNRQSIYENLFQPHLSSCRIDNSSKMVHKMTKHNLYRRIASVIEAKKTLREPVKSFRT